MSMSTNEKIDRMHARAQKRTAVWVTNPCDVRTRCVGCMEMIAEGKPMAVQIVKIGGTPAIYRRFHADPACKKKAPKP